MSEIIATEEEEDQIKLSLYLEERARSEGSADNFKVYVCPCEECVAKRAIVQVQESEDEESEDEDDEEWE